MTEQTYKGHVIRTSDMGYSAYKDGACVAAGGVFGSGEYGNRVAARQAIREIISGKRKPLNGSAQ